MPLLYVVIEAIDVFETSDLPEVDQHMFSAEPDTDDNVEILPITTNEAFGRFKGDKRRITVIVNKGISVRILH